MLTGNINDRRSTGRHRGIIQGGLSVTFAVEGLRGDGAVASCPRDPIWWGVSEIPFSRVILFPPQRMRDTMMQTGYTPFLTAH